MKPAFKYIYGPVPSWRLGSSLGIDLLSQERKICNFDCVYCQLGPTSGYTAERKAYAGLKEVMEELESLPRAEIDYITFSGRGEPALAANLGEAINAVETIRKENIAVLTNASLMDRKDVREDLSQADFVVAKLDAFSRESLKEINNGASGIEFSAILEGLKKFRRDYKGRLALQMMFMDKNKGGVDKLIYLANYIKPDEIQVNTPLRPCNVKPLAEEELLGIKSDFIAACRGIEVVSVYDQRALKDVASFSDKDTLKRRGKI